MLVLRLALIVGNLSFSGGIFSGSICEISGTVNFQWVQFMQGSIQRSETMAPACNSNGSSPGSSILSNYKVLDAA